jgi:hypothetical protein
MGVSGVEKGAMGSRLSSGQQLPMARLDRGGSMIHVWDVVDQRPEIPVNEDE